MTAASSSSVLKKVTSRDGTRIAFERSGAGPALVIVDGAMCSRQFGPSEATAAALAPSFTVTEISVEADPSDKRVTRIRLTSHAIALRDRLADESMAANREAADALTAKELETLKSLLRKVIAGLV